MFAYYSIIIVIVIIFINIIVTIIAIIIIIIRIFRTDECVFESLLLLHGGGELYSLSVL